MDTRRVAKRIRKSVHKSQKSHKFHAYHWLMCFYNNRLLAINLCRLALGGQTVKNLHLLASKFELDQSQHKYMQVVASGWPNEMQIERKSKTCINLRVCLARALNERKLPFEDKTLNDVFQVLSCSIVLPECWYLIASVHITAYTIIPVPKCFWSRIFLIQIVL